MILRAMRSCSPMLLGINSLDREKSPRDRKGQRGFIFVGLILLREQGERMVCGEKAGEGRTLRGKDIR